LIYGENSITVLDNLKAEKKRLTLEANELKSENQRLQKEYFELKNLEPSEE
jgi:cell shape-determining protein MreC